MKQILSREYARKVHRNIRRMNGSQNDTSTSRIEVKGDDGETIKEITEKEELEKQIMQTNKKKFLQYKDTPFYKDPLSLYFDEACRSEYFEEIYEGTFEFQVDTDK